MRDVIEGIPGEKIPIKKSGPKFHFCGNCGISQIPPGDTRYCPDCSPSESMKRFLNKKKIGRL